MYPDDLHYVPPQFRSYVTTKSGRVTEVLLIDRKLTSLPEWLRNLTALTSLKLSFNRLARLPEWIGDLTSLTKLQLKENQLLGLPKSFWGLTALTELDLSGNRLVGIPKSIGKLTSLTELDLRENSLHSLPESIGNLTALKRLNLSDNNLTDLPESIGNLAVLTELNLTGNKLTSLPSQLADCLTNGLYLRMNYNLLHDPLPEIAARGADALATYLASLDETMTQFEAKLLLVGEGNVGKTSLVAALRGAPFVEGRPTTHGIEIWPLTFRHPDIDRDMTLRAWDFGGQDVYRVTHQFFFSRRALYVVVWNARQGQEQDEVEGWLRRIRLRVGRDARIMVVATHCEERLPELDYPHLEHAFPDMLAGNFEVDNRTGAGIPELREAIGRAGGAVAPDGPADQPSLGSRP